ncbi:hypothetical protein ACP70R_032786 [Stipagrostis hirtigluma subsp. patula]
MASQQTPPPLPPPPAAAKHQAPNPTTISALSDDLLREIFLRLPSLPPLVRAALTCRAFLAAVRSSPAFRRRFRTLHPSPLLGFFFDPDGPAIPAFAPLRRRSDPALAAAVRGADFFLTRLPASSSSTGAPSRSPPTTPLTGSLDLLPTPPDEICNDCRGVFVYMDFFLLCSGEAPGPFRVVGTFHDESRARAAVFSSDTREWQISPWTEATTPQTGDNEYWLYGGSLVNGSVYWTHTNQAYMLVLNTVTLQFSRVDLPRCLKGQGHNFRTGETREGKPCVVGALEFTLLMWLWRSGDDGVERWMLDKMFPLQTQIVEVTGGSLDDHGALKVLAIIDGFVYLSTFETFNDADQPCWFLSFCLETMELEKFFQRRYDSHVHPYIMAWPPSLIGNRVNPQLEGP